MVVSDDVADALVLKLKAAGFDIDLETVTCAELLVALQSSEIRSARKFKASDLWDACIYRGQDNTVVARDYGCTLTTPDQSLTVEVRGQDSNAVIRMALFMVDACNRYLP